MNAVPGFAAMRARWHGLSPGERRLLVGLLLLLVATALWFTALSPAWRTVASAPTQIDKLDLQLQSLQHMAAQAKQLQVRPVMARSDAVRALDTLSTQRFAGLASLQSGADRTTVNLKGVASEALVAWLGQVRQNIGVVVEQANLRQVGGNWEGTLVLSLPASP